MSHNGCACLSPLLMINTINMNDSALGSIQLEDMLNQSRLFSEGVLKRAKRSSLGKNLKGYVLEYGNGLPCPICNNVMRNGSISGGGCIPNTVTVEHILPLAMGGRNNAENVVPMCKTCNRIRGQLYNEYSVNTPEGRAHFLKWLWYQLHPRVLSAVSTISIRELFPDLEGLFWKKWRDAYRLFSTEPIPQSFVESGPSKRRRVDMSASARSRRPSQRRVSN
ncbi:MAG: HNH endonuclease signature motif containing protein [Candidatus Thermoplasmatota archaeon]|nr:HNH endonuclease signature motif containing protein [Candidatus Thermoplasmatota archaeon]